MHLSGFMARRVFEAMIAMQGVLPASNDEPHQITQIINKNSQSPTYLDRSTEAAEEQGFTKVLSIIFFGSQPEMKDLIY